jgi:hypothetical protein
VANEGSNRGYRFIGVSDGHHDLSHHKGDAEKLAKIRLINRFHTEQFARFIGNLAAIREGERSLLDNSMILFASGFRDGNRHDPHNLPVVLAGKAGGTLTPGRHLVYEKNTPLCNLYQSMLGRMGTPVEKLADSTGELSDLLV